MENVKLSFKLNSSFLTFQWIHNPNVKSQTFSEKCPVKLLNITYDKKQKKQKINNWMKIQLIS